MTDDKNTDGSTTDSVNPASGAPASEIPTPEKVAAPATPPVPATTPVAPATTPVAPSTTPAAPTATTAAPATPEPAPKKTGPSDSSTPEDEKKSAPAMSAGLAKITRDLKEKAISEHAKKLGLNYINLDKTPINPDLASIVPYEVAHETLAIPFFRIGKKLRIAVADAESPQVKALLIKLKNEGYVLNTNLASDQSIKEAVERLYADLNKSKRPDIVTQVDVSEIESYEKELENLSQLAEKLKTVMAEEGLNMLNVGAIKTGTSDVHIQPEEDKVQVRFRIDGFLQKVMELDHKTYANLTNQMKYKSGMKLNINNIPQDGRFHFMFNDRKIDVRVSALPTEYGETFVCRLLDSGKEFLGLDQCNFIGRNLEIMNKSLKISHGMILVTGPTGSGKTTTLYSMLHQFNQPQVKVVTLEDPIEYHLKGIAQSQVNPKRGFTFSSGLRSILRQDPDIVMVGEIRDMETAETAAQAALTGHVLLSTLHTNSALETIPRLINIGIAPFMVAPSLHMIVAQRLVRKLCEHCKQELPISETEKQEIMNTCAEITKVSPSTKFEIPTTLWHPRECKQCSHTGYSGRLGVHEILVVDNDIKDAILKNSSLKELTAMARKQGMLMMKEDGILKVLRNETTLEEVRRVTAVLGEDSGEFEKDESANSSPTPAPTTPPQPTTPPPTN
jgi:type IV pilus assembly protein PilB